MDRFNTNATRIFLAKVFVICFSQVCVECQHLSDVQRLLKDKTENYTKVLRPLYDQSKNLNIYTSFDLVSIQEFEEREGKVTVTGILFTAWFDELFAWNPNEYGGTTYVILDTTYIWVPAMTLTNAVGEMDKVSRDWHSLVIFNTGLVHYYGGGIFSFTCDVDVSYYPWDRQKCQLWFTPWGYGVDQLNIFQINETIYQTYYSENGEWTLIGSSTGVIPNSVIFFFELFLERQPRFVVINVIAPIMVMSFLNILIFLIPIDSGERISYSLTVLLAVAVFLTLVGDNLPKTSDPMSFLSYYLLAVLIMSVCITLATICSLRLYHSGENEKVSSFWRCIALFGKCRCLRKTRSVRYSKHNGSRLKANENCNSYLTARSAKEEFYPNFKRSKVWSVSSFMKTPEVIDDSCVIYNPEAENKRCSEQHSSLYYGNNKGDDDISWKDVSDAVDRVFLGFFFVSLVGLSFGFLFYTRYGSEIE